MTFIHFRKARYMVPIRCLAAYLRWSWQTASGGAIRKWKGILYGMYAPWPVIRPDPVIASAISGCEALVTRIGWIRYPTDGTRLQVFDHHRGKILKMAKPIAGLASLEQELGWRGKVGDLAPNIRGVSRHPPAYLEEWVEGRAGDFSVRELRRVILLLAERLYRVEWLGLDEYLRRASLNFSAEATSRMGKAMFLAGWDKLPTSPVHGDLVCQNILFRYDGNPVLIDWEYARVCVVSQDLWFYLFHDTPREHSGSDLPDSFFREMEHALAWIGLDVRNVRALHLIHLLEREALLMNNAPVVISTDALSDIRLNMKRTMDHLEIAE